MIRMTDFWKMNVRHQVNFLFLIPASKLPQVWSEPFANEVDKKAKSSLGICKLCKGWWSYCLAKRLLFPSQLQHNNYRRRADPDDFCRDGTQYDAPGELKYVGYKNACSLFRTGVLRISRTVTKIHHMCSPRSLIKINVINMHIMQLETV